ncbi:MAG: cytochrome c3 family protein [Planctomycetota bacterium]
MAKSSQPSDKPAGRFQFPRWANFLLPFIVLNAVGAAVYVPTVVFSALNPTTLNVGYRPEQPVPYSHALHVGQLGMDCRYCHTTVDEAGFAAIPSTQTCMNCHTAVETESLKLAPVRESWETGQPIEWTKVHDLADYSYFNHSAHINKGIGCYSCHGRVDHMGEEGVYQAEPLNMGWCLDCHRQPEKFIRPISEVTNMDYHLGKGGTEEGGPGDLVVMGDETPEEAQLRVGKILVEQYNIKDQAYMTACSTCHR